MILEYIEKSLKSGRKVFSVTGSGGKTTLIKHIALHFAEQYSVAVGASTKMLVPDDSWNTENGKIDFYYDSIQNGKLAGFSEALIDRVIECHDIILVEADGSAKKPLKGWNETEPVIPEKTDVTIGIIPLHLLGKVLKEQDVHRWSYFTSITGAKSGDIFTLEMLIKLVGDPRGLFKESLGERVIYLSHARSIDETMINVLLKQLEPFVEHVLLGDLNDD